MQYAKIPLAAAIFSAFVNAASAQAYTTRVDVDREMIGPFPAHTDCVRKVVQKHLGDETIFYKSNNGVSGAFVGTSGFKEISVEMQGGYISGVGVTIAEDEIAVEGQPPFAGIMSSIVQYHPRKGGTIETTINGQETNVKSPGFLQAVDRDLRECNLTG